MLPALTALGGTRAAHQGQLISASLCFGITGDCLGLGAFKLIASYRRTTASRKLDSTGRETPVPRPRIRETSEAPHKRKGRTT